MAKDTFYFSHDCNARSDQKIQNLIFQHGMQGYGIFWAIIEDLYTNANALRMDCKRIAFNLHADESMVKSILNDFELFEISDVISSDSVRKRLEKRADKTNKARSAALIKWDKDASALQTHTKKDANAMPIKKSKGKEIIKRNRKKKVFVPPLLEDVKKYFAEKGYKVEIAEKAFEGYSEANWHDSKGNPVLNWKQKMINVWFTPENLERPKLTMQEIGRRNFEGQL